MSTSVVADYFKIKHVFYLRKYNFVCFILIFEIYISLILVFLNFFFKVMHWLKSSTCDWSDSQIHFNDPIGSMVIQSK